MSVPNPKLQATTTIDAPVEAVWAHLSDPRIIAGLSPQVVTSVVRGAAPIGVGTKFVNVNREGWKVWPTRAIITRYEPNRVIAFRVNENRAIWSFELQPVAGGTRVLHRREIPYGVSKASETLQEKVLGGMTRFEGELEKGMARTLERLSDAVSSSKA